LQDLDAPRTTQFGPGPNFLIPQILQIPAFVDAGDFLKPGKKFMFRPFSNFPAFNDVKKNDRIFGSVNVSCPNCIKDRNYLLFFVNGGGGWYAEIQKDPNMDFRGLLDDTDATLLKAVFLNKRITISAP
jgi:hypothetical protein